MASVKPRVCIVGSGPGGGVAALELAKSGEVRVIVVDTDRISPSYSQSQEMKLGAVYTGHPFNQEITRGFGYGGSSNLWHGVVTKLDEEDWRFIDLAAGEAISSEIKSLYGELRNTFGELPDKANSRLSGMSLGNDLYKELELSGKFRSKDFFLQKRPFRVRDALVRIKESGSDLEFVERATALYLTGSRDRPNQAAGLVVIVDGQKKTVEADYFILAAGALETPRIILQGNEEGHFSISNENIGRHLFDHPWAVIGEIVSKKGWFRLGLSDVYAAPGLRYRIGYRLQESVDNPQIGSNHCIAFKPHFFGDYVSFKESMKNIVTHKLSLKSICELLRKFSMLDILASLALLVCEKFALGVFVKKSLVFCYLEQPVRAQSTVTLANGYDLLGRRVPAVNWVVGKAEAENITLIKDTLSTAISRSSRFSFFPYDNPTGSMTSGAHHAGTMRIGKSPADGVIDKDLKLFGAENVFLCDLSIFPNYGNSNPTLTLAAFSLRLARHLLDLFQKVKYSNEI